MRLAPLVAAALVVAAAVLAVVAFAGGDEAPATAAAVAPAPPAGLAVWVAQGCGGCHTLGAANSHGTFGPDLGETLRGLPASYVRRSIVDPEAATAPDWEPGGMPGDYARRMSAADLDLLVGFLLAAARG